MTQRFTIDIDSLDDETMPPTEEIMLCTNSQLDQDTHTIQILDEDLRQSCLFRPHGVILLLVLCLLTIASPFIISAILVRVHS